MNWSDYWLGVAHGMAVTIIIATITAKIAGVHVNHALAAFSVGSTLKHGGSNE